MPRRILRVTPPDAMTDGLAALRAEAELPAAFPPEVEAEAREAIAARPRADKLDVPFVTIDPPGSKDLDQAMHIERVGDGHRVRYAIADVASFVAAGGAIDREVHTRGVTVYVPVDKVPLHPTTLSEGAASLLPGQQVPAIVWTIDLDASGAPTKTTVDRAEVTSTAQHTYEDLPADRAQLLQEVGEKRLAAERARGGIRLAVPEQEVVREGDGWTTKYRIPLATEDWNAQVSLLAGMEAARLMLEHGTGILRTQAPPREKDYRKLRRQAQALGVDWPEDVEYPEFVRTLDYTVPAQAAFAQAATGLAHGAGYTVFDGALPELSTHFAVAASYAHATAPLRRLQDRFVSECCLAASAGEPVPQWVRDGLAALPEAMANGTRRANKVERQVVDLVEALLLEGRVGETFEGVVVDDGLVQIGDPAVRARLDGEGAEPGAQVTVRLTVADPSERDVRFEPVTP